METNQSTQSQSNQKQNSKGPNVILIIVIILVILILLGGGTGYYLYYRAKKAIKSVTNSIPATTFSNTSSGDTSQMPAKDVTGADLTDISRYPLSIRTAYNKNSDGTYTDINYKVKATSDQILTYYKTQLPANGWTLSNSQEDSLSYQKGNDEITVNILDTTDSITEYTLEFLPNYL